MLGNYLITAVRAFKKQKQHFALNLLGLSVGLAAAILVALFAQNELSYDSQQPDAERVYRINQDFTKIGSIVLPLFNYVKAAATLNESQVEDVFALTMVDSNKKVNTAVKYEGQGYKLDAIYGATPNIEKFINIDVIAGDLKNALTTPDSLALSESEAIRIYGGTNVIGKTLSHVDGQYTVRAVFADLPQNTHFAFNSLTYIEHDKANTRSNFSYVYVKLTDSADPEAYAKSLTEQSITGRFKGKISLSLMPLLDIHLNAKSMAEFKTGGERQSVMICVGLSVLLILIASFNFINMAVAQFTKRSKEVGVRKALGASKSQLIIQFLLESTLMSLLATIVACVLVTIVLPSFSGLVERELFINYFSEFGAMILAVAILVGVVVGLYPAFVISSFSTRSVLNGELQYGKTATVVRKCLLVLQATISITLIIAAIIMNQQLAYLQSLPMGYETKHRVVISELPMELVYAKESPALFNRLKSIDGVKQATVLGFDIIKTPLGSAELTWPNGEQSEDRIPLTGASFDVVETLGLKLLAGRDFSTQFAADWNYQVTDPLKRTVGAIVTKSVAKQAGYDDFADIIGKTIVNAKFSTDMRVVGVVDDIKMGNERGTEKKLIFLCGYPSSRIAEVVLAIEQQSANNVQQQVVEILGDHANIFEPKVNMLVDNYKAVYRNDERVSKVVSLFTFLAIFLTMLGTFGLASFAALRRQKEVSMRKVLGASRISIVNLLAKEFLTLVVISMIFAFPLTYWLVGDWLANFNDRVSQALWIYAVAALIVAVITWLTVASLAFKAASTRPSLILRYE